MCIEVFTDPAEDDFGKAAVVEGNGKLSLMLGTEAVGQIAVKDLFA